MSKVNQEVLKRFGDLVLTEKSVEKALSKFKPGRAKKEKAEGPKRALSAYIFFCTDNRPLVVKELASTGSKPSDVLVQLGQRWKNASAEVRAKYESMALKDRERYSNELTSSQAPAQPVVVVSVPAPTPAPAPAQTEAPAVKKVKKVTKN